MTVDGIDEVVRAIRAIQDISTQNSDRIRYTQAIELLKDGPTKESLPTSFALVYNEDKFTAHVGWNIIEHVVKYKWRDLSNEEKLGIRNKTLEYISNGGISMAPSDSHLRTAISRVVVAIIEYDWPQDWKEMFGQFGMIVADTNYISQCQMVFLILGRFVENIYTLVTVENNIRRKQLQNALNVHIGDLIQMIVQRLRVCINSGSGNEQQVLLAISAIELLSEIFDWVSGKTLAGPIDDVIDVLCAYLQVETCGIYEVSANSLLKLAMRKRIKMDELPIIISMFRNQPMQAILTACSLAASSSNTSEEHYKFLKLLCDLLCSLGIHLAEVWSNIPGQLENFPLYLNALTEFFMHPSLYIRLESSYVLVAFSTTASINRSPILLEKMPAILAVLPKSMEKIGWLNDTNTPTCQYSRMDYDSEAEFLHEYTKLRDRCARLIRENMESHFAVLSSTVTNWINERCIKQTSAITSSEWDSMKRYITAYLQAAQQLDMIKTDVQQWLVILMENVFKHLGTIMNYPAIVNEMLSILSAFFIVLEFEPSRIPPILELIKLLLLTAEEKDNQSGNNEDIVSLKRHCINLLLKLVTTLPNAIKQYVQNILDVVVSVAPMVSAMQKANLVQILAALSNVTDGIENQRIFLNAALSDVIVFFESEEFKTYLTTQGLLSNIGALDVAPTSDREARESTYFLNRIKLKSQLSSIEGAMAQVCVPTDRSNPLFDSCLPVIRNIFQFITCVNSVYGTRMLSSIHPSYRNGLFTLSTVERQRIIYSSTVGLDVEEVNSSQTTQTDAIAHMSRFFIDIGDMIQNVVGLSGSRFRYDFYNLPDSQKLIEAAFSNADNLPDFRLRFWIKRAWSPLISNCPADKASVVASITASLCQHLHALLTARWNTIKNYNEGEDGDVTEEELFSQQMICILSREYSSFLSQLIMKPNFPTKDDPKKPPLEAMTPLAIELLKDQTVLEPIIASICLLINCPDTKTVMKLVPLARQIIGSRYTSFDTEMATNTLVHSIRSLQVNGGDEACIGPLLGLTFMIYSLLRPNHPTFLNVLEQVPELSPDTRREFDDKIVNLAYNKENFGEKCKRDLMKKILKSVIASKTSEEFRRPVPLQQVRKNTFNMIT